MSFSHQSLAFAVSARPLVPLQPLHRPSTITSLSPFRFYLPFSRTSHFIRPFLRPSLQKPYAIQRRVTPSCHSTCHSGHADRASEATLPSNPIIDAMARLASLRSSLLLACASAALLILSAMLHVARMSPVFLIRLPLIATLALTGLPALAETTLMLSRDRSSALSVDVLMTLAALISVLTGAFFEAALLTTLFALSFSAEHMVSARAHKHLDELRRATPDTAQLLSSATSQPRTVPLDSVVPGDLLLVRVGQLAPCDGSLIHSAALVSVAHLTGESVPVTKQVGDSIQAGTRPQDAPLILRVTNTGAESFLARIARLVTAAQQNRPRVARFFDKFGDLYTRIVLGISFAIAVLLPICVSIIAPNYPPIPYAGRNGSIMRGLGVLVVASPCALLIGAPIAYTAALSACARRGVLVKGGARALDSAAATSHVIFDKTGTLTTGRLRLTDTHSVPSEMQLLQAKIQGNRTHSYLDGLENGNSPFFVSSELSETDMARVVSAAAALERGAIHPIADAVRRKANELGGDLPEVSEAKVIAGQGVEGVLSFQEGDGLTIVKGKFGRPSFILEVGCDAYRSVSREAALKGETVSVLEIGDEQFLLRMKDDVREEAGAVVKELKRQGLAVTVLTGDANGAANFVSDAIGGGLKVMSNATPAEKMNYVRDLGEKLERDGRGVLMIGDGVNDGAALAAALVGIACGLSNATAVDAAEVVLVREDLNNVTWFLRKARATGRVVKQNMAIAIVLMVLAGAACVIGNLPLWLAVTLHEGGTILVGVNGLRLLGER